MASKLVEMLGLSAKDQESIKKSSGRMKSVAEFISDTIKATETVDFLKSLAESTPWWLQAVGESVAEAAPPIKFLATLIGKLGEIKDPDRLAYLAFTTAYQRSLEKALQTVGPPTSSKSRQSRWTPNRDILTPDEGMSFETYSLSDPLNHPFLRQATDILTNGMAAAGYNDSEVRRIQNEVAIRFPGCLKSLITHPSTREKYVAFAEWMRYGNKEARVHAAWSDHCEYQRYLFEEQCVFGEEPFSLSEIYVETECGVLSCEEVWKEAQKQECDCTPGRRRLSTEHKRTDPFCEECGGRHDLLGSVMELIGDKSFRDAIVVQGPAGSGKSAFTVRLAMELLRNGLIPIRIRFKDIPLSSMNVEDALPEAVRFWDIDQRPDDLPAAKPEELFLDKTLFDQRVDFNGVSICPYVLILDGWDEVSVAAQKGFSVRIGEILTQVRDRFLNRGHRTQVRVVLTGRPSAAVSDSSFLTKQTRLLTIRPLAPSKLEDFVACLAPRLVDPRHRDNADFKRFSAILSQYADDFKARTTEQPDSEHDCGTMEVLGLPLLTHLAVRLMVRWPDSDLAPLVQNPTTLYRQLTNLTCEKGGRYGKEVYDPGFPGKDLRELLHETAVAMTVYGRDSIPYDELDLRLSQMDEDLLKRVQQVTEANPVTSLMINFFFKGGRTELGAEFLHKSFREFLFAEAIVETLKQYGRTAPEKLDEQSSTRYEADFGEGDPRRDLSRRLGKLLGPQWLTKEVCLFVEGLLRWELARSHGAEKESALGATTESLPIPQWQRVADGLADLWNWWGEGVHLRVQPKFLGKKITEWTPPLVNELVHWAMPQDQPKGEVPVAPRTTTLDGHLGDGLCRLALLVHHYLAVAPGDESNWEDFDEEAKDVPSVRRYQALGRRNGKWAARFAPSGPDTSYFRNYAARINAAGWCPLLTFPSGLFMESVHFAGCMLHFSGFFLCRLRGANLRGAGLAGVCFYETDLSGADLSMSMMVGTSFIRCQLHGAFVEHLAFRDCLVRDCKPNEVVKSLTKPDRLPF